MPLKLRTRSLTLPQAVDAAIKQGIPMKAAIRSLAERGAALGSSKAGVQNYVRARYRIEKQEKRTRVALRAVVRKRALKRANATVRWLYACLADQHGTGDNVLDARRPTLKRLYAWEPSQATVNRAIDALLELRLIACIKSRPHSKWARYRLVQNVH